MNSWVVGKGVGAVAEAAEEVLGLVNGLAVSIEMIRSQNWELLLALPLPWVLAELVLSLMNS